MGDADCTKLAMEILGNPRDIPWDMLTETITKSGGNPLFLEEYLKALVLSGAITYQEGKVVFKRDLAGIGLPRTLRGIFAERLSRLSEENKNIIKIAAVIGNTFAVDTLGEVMGKPIYQLAMILEELETSGVLTRSSVMEYSFKHDFFRETVYDSLPYNSRRSLHEKVAAAIEASPTGRPGCTTRRG